MTGAARDESEELRRTASGVAALGVEGTCGNLKDVHDLETKGVNWNRRPREIDHVDEMGPNDTSGLGVEIADAAN